MEHEEQKDYQSFNLVIKRYADDQGSLYQIFSSLGLERGGPPLGEAPTLSEAFEQAAIHTRFMEHARVPDAS